MSYQPESVPSPGLKTAMKPWQEFCLAFNRVHEVLKDLNLPPWRKLPQGRRSHPRSQLESTSDVWDDALEFHTQNSEIRVRTTTACVYPLLDVRTDSNLALSQHRTALEFTRLSTTRAKQILRALQICGDVEKKRLCLGFLVMIRIACLVDLSVLKSFL